MVWSFYQKSIYWCLILYLPSLANLTYLLLLRLLWWCATFILLNFALSCMFWYLCIIVIHQISLYYDMICINNCLLDLSRELIPYCWVVMLLVVHRLMFTLCCVLQFSLVVFLIYQSYILKCYLTFAWVLLYLKYECLFRLCVCDIEFVGVIIWNTINFFTFSYYTGLYPVLNLKNYTSAACRKSNILLKKFGVN